MQAALLATIYSTAIDAEIYRRYLFRQAKEYLTSVTQLPNSCTVLIAVMDAQEAALAGASGADQYRMPLRIAE
jgi:hypothetical protein